MFINKEEVEIEWNDLPPMFWNFWFIIQRFYSMKMWNLSDLNCSVKTYIIMHNEKECVRNVVRKIIPFGLKMVGGFEAIPI